MGENCYILTEKIMSGFFAEQERMARFESMRQGPRGRKSNSKSKQLYAKHQDLEKQYKKQVRNLELVSKVIHADIRMKELSMRQKYDKLQVTQQKCAAQSEKTHSLLNELEQAHLEKELTLYAVQESEENKEDQGKQTVGQLLTSVDQLPKQDYLNVDQEHQHSQSAMDIRNNEALRPTRKSICEIGNSQTPRPTRKSISEIVNNSTTRPGRKSVTQMPTMMKDYLNVEQEHLNAERREYEKSSKDKPEVKDNS